MHQWESVRRAKGAPKTDGKQESHKGGGSGRHTCPPHPPHSSIWIVANTAGYEEGRSPATVFPVWVPRYRKRGTGGPWGWALERGAVWATGQAGEGPAGIQRER